MFENYKQMSAEEQARVKALHKAVRSDYSCGDRYRNLAWGYVRGFAFRRIERSHRLQRLDEGAYFSKTDIACVETPEGRFFEHNMPDVTALTKLLAKHLPEFASDLAEYPVKPNGRVEQWLRDRSGAISAPARKAKAA